MIVTILATLFVLGVLIFVHEFGHFIIAKLFGIRVERFSLGYPPRAFGFKRGDTDYCVSWLPLGGYCKLSGMIDESLEKDSVKGEPWEFQSKHPLIRFVTILAGPGMNFVLAIVIFTVLAFYFGTAIPSNRAEVGTVMENSPAENTGLKEGDLILSIDGEKVTTWEEMTKIIRSNEKNRPQKFEIKRGEELYIFEIISKEDKALGRIIGIGQAVETKQVGIFGAIKEGFVKSYDLAALVIVSIKKIITSEVSLRDSFGGPILIAKLAGDSARSGIWSLMFFMAL